MIVSVGPSILYRIPRQQIVLPKAEEIIISSSSIDHAQKKSISAAQASFNFGQSFSSNLLIIF
jgi:hypothetical protein